MALLVDGIKLQESELTPYESSIADVARTEGIDAATKANIAALEIGMELQRFLIGMPSAALYTLTNVAITDGLRQWHVFRTLASIYRDAHHQQLNERYKQKWREYERLARHAKQLLLDSGLGIVYRPIPKAATPTLGQVAGDQPARTYYVRAVWVDGGGVEGSPSECASITTMEGTALTVTPGAAPVVAKKWRVYAGWYDDQLSNQTPDALEIGTVWTLPPGGLIAGTGPGEGQSPDHFLRQIPVLQRG